MLREHIARYRVGSSDEDATVRYFPAYEREDLVQQLELSREQVWLESLSIYYVGGLCIVFIKMMGRCIQMLFSWFSLQMNLNSMSLCIYV